MSCFQQGILVVTPEGPLEKADFEQLTPVVDSFVADKGALKGLMIYAEFFPGWSDFAALITHLKFVKEHHKQFTRVAAVTDDGFLTVMPRIADHFVHARVMHFDYAKRQEALTWLGGGTE
jgi:hypothetical protein